MKKGRGTSGKTCGNAANVSVGAASGAGSEARKEPLSIGLTELAERDQSKSTQAVEAMDTKTKAETKIETKSKPRDVAPTNNDQFIAACYNDAHAHPYFLSLRAIRCCDFQNDGKMYLQDRRVVQFADYLMNHKMSYISFDLAFVSKMLAELSIQIEQLWKFGLSFGPLCEEDLRFIDGVCCIANPSKILELSAADSQFYCLTKPIYMGKYCGPEVSMEMVLPCEHFCRKQSVLYSIGRIACAMFSTAYSVEEPNEEQILEMFGQSNLMYVVKRLLSPKPERRLPVVL